MTYLTLISTLKGGAGSGFHGHSGRPGKIGGSAGTVSIAAGLVPGLPAGSYTVISKAQYNRVVMAAAKAGPGHVAVCVNGEYYAINTGDPSITPFFGAYGAKPLKVTGAKYESHPAIQALLAKAAAPPAVPAPTPPKPAVTLPLNKATHAEVVRDQQLRFSPDEIKKATDNLKDLVKDAPVCMRVPKEIFNKILDSGEFLNQHKTGTSRGTLSPDYRKRAERNAFGDHLSKPDDFPVYGYMGTGVSGRHTPGASGYGSIKIVFKDEVKDRTTITAFDSLGPFTRKSAVGTPARNPDQASLNYQVNSWQDKYVSTSYVEAQIHGKLTPRDIKKVYIPDDVHPKYRKGMIDRLNKMGIPYVEYAAGTPISTVEEAFN